MVARKLLGKKKAAKKKAQTQYGIQSFSRKPGNKKWQDDSFMAGSKDLSIAFKGTRKQAVRELGMIRKEMGMSASRRTTMYQGRETKYKMVRV